MLKMNKNYKFLVIVLFFFLSCSNDGHIVINLENEHLENTEAGSWIGLFNIDYSPNAPRLKSQITNQLEGFGNLIDEYTHEQGSNSVKTKVWKYKGQKIKEEYYIGGIWAGSEKVIPFQQYYNGGLNTWITIEFEYGKSYSELIPNHFQEINRLREYEHTVTIESKVDNGRRLFLFGYGSTCESISLF